MATQSERLGYEFAKRLGVRTPQVYIYALLLNHQALPTMRLYIPDSFSSVTWEMQARVIHNTSPEWLQIKEAAEKARDAANSEGDETGNMTCSELLEALELSRCLFFMGYDPNQGLVRICLVSYCGCVNHFSCFVNFTHSGSNGVGTANLSLTDLFTLF